MAFLLSISSGQGSPGTPDSKTQTIMYNGFGRRANQTTLKEQIACHLSGMEDGLWVTLRFFPPILLSWQIFIRVVGGQIE